MVSRKYVGDYRLENRTNPKTGRVVTVPVYRGDWYAFAADAQTVRRMKRVYPALSALCIAMFLLVLLLNAPSGHIFYVTMPFAALIFPVYFSAAGSWRLLTAKDRITREHSDKLQPRFTSCALFLTSFSAVSVCGHILYWFRVGVTLLDAVSFAATAVILASGMTMFRLRENLKTVRKA